MIRFNSMEMISVLTILFSIPPSVSWTNLAPSRSNARAERLPIAALSVGSNLLDQMLSPNSSCDPSQMSPTSLAYIGDSVFELFVRSRYVWPARRTTDLQNLVVGRVRAETQSKIFRKLLTSDTFQLSKEERNIVSRGRNAGSSSGGRKRGPKRLYGSNDGRNSENGGPEVYQDSTAMEALIGFIYLTNKDRCVDIMKFLAEELDKIDDEEGVVR